MATCGIYVIEHIETNRRYVGQSVHIEKRLVDHQRNKSDSFIGRTIAKYGWDSFSFSIVETCEVYKLNLCETKWINLLGSIDPNGFNLTSGGRQAAIYSVQARKNMSDGAMGKKLSESHKAKIKAALTTDEKLAQARATALQVHIDKKEKISIAQKSRKVSEETKKKTSQRFKGKHLSDEHKRKISASTKGRVHSLESLAKRAKNLAIKHGR